MWKMCIENIEATCEAGITSQTILQMGISQKMKANQRTYFVSHPTHGMPKKGDAPEGIPPQSSHAWDVKSRRHTRRYYTATIPCMSCRRKRETYLKELRRNHPSHGMPKKGRRTWRNYAITIPCMGCRKREMHPKELCCNHPTCGMQKEKRQPAGITPR